MMITMMITIVIGYLSSILSGDPVMVGDVEMTHVEMYDIHTPVCGM